MKKFSAIVKIIVIAIVVTFCNFYTQSLSPIIANEFALYQMTNNPDSSSVLYLHSVFMNYIWVVPVSVSIILFLPEIITIIKHINKKRKEITKNEENN